MKLTWRDVLDCKTFMVMSQQELNNYATNLGYDYYIWNTLVYEVCDEGPRRTELSEDDL